MRSITALQGSSGSVFILSHSLKKNWQIQSFFWLMVSTRKVSRAASRFIKPVSSQLLPEWGHGSPSSNSRDYLELQKQLVLSCPWIKGTEENLRIERPGNPVRESLWTISPNPSGLSFFPFLFLSLMSLCILTFLKSTVGKGPEIYC